MRTDPRPMSRDAGGSVAGFYKVRITDRDGVPHEFPRVKINQKIVLYDENDQVVAEFNEGEWRRYEFTSVGGEFLSRKMTRGDYKR